LLLHREVEPDHFETWKNLYEYSWDKGEHDFLMDHGFVGNEINSKHDPIYVDESFQDAKEEEVEAEVDTEHKDPSKGGPPKIELPPCFPNLISGYVEIPEFTNYAVDFTETLDYILASEPASEEGVGFEASAAAPVPTSLEMKDYVAMPNEFMPSDHVSIVCDLKWKQFGK
jgi:hypothetical protein